jgi:hypothetical protein
MIPAKTKKTFETFSEEDLEQKGFKIKQSKEAFKILSSGLYSDKILAVIRELSANAWDSHRQAGKPDLPIEVHLPTTFEPYFYVKDFGTGLSHDEVMNLYVTYFDSTKRDTNEATGMLGLGSKSPFSYTDQFTVTSRYEGVKRTYSCFVNESGAPSITPLDAKPSDEPNGVEIYMSVNTNDINEFKVKAERVYKYYDVMPNILNSEKIDFRFPNHEIADSFTLPNSGVPVKLFKSQGYRESTVVIQGASAYPVDMNKIEGIDSELKRVYDVHMVLEFPIGTLNITASRESLEYDKPTCMNLGKIADELREYYAHHIAKQFKGIKTEWEACVLARTIDRMPSVIRPKDIPLWKGKTMQDLRNGIKLNLTQDKQVVDENGVKQTRTTAFAQIRYADHYSLHQLKNIRLDESWSTGKHRVEPSDVAAIVVNTERVKQYTKILAHNFRGNDEYRQLLYITPTEGNEDRTWREVSKQFDGCENIFKLKDLEEPPKIIDKDGNAKPISKIHQWTGRSWGDVWDAVSKNKETGGIYVHVYNRTPLGYYSKDAFKSHVTKARELGLIPEKMPIYGIFASNKTVINNNDRWVDLDDLILKKLEKKLEGVDVEGLSRRRQERDYVYNEGYFHSTCRRFREVCPKIKETYDYWSKVRKDSAFTDALKLVTIRDEIIKRRERLHEAEARKDNGGTLPDNYVSPYKVTSDGKPKVEKALKAESMKEKLQELYPLLFDNDDELYKDYIKQTQDLLELKGE